MIRVRFAPSPTGFLHIGGARTCLFNWLYARNLGGQFILRIEDTDVARSKKEYLDEILESIKWLGMDWDEIYYQSQRFELYQQYAKKLVNQGKAYKKEGAIFFKYDFKSIQIDDLIRGKIVFKEMPKDEEVIIKSDNSPTYNFCCCIDDALMNINCVLRGEDHISNTPKQILIYKALGFDIPKFAHLPLILSPSGGRLSKRFGATSIREYKELGYLPEAISNYLMLLGWSLGHNREIISLSEAKDIFDIKEINKAGAIFAIEKLNWVNSEYIKAKSLEEITNISRDYLKENGHLPEDISEEYLKKIIFLLKERVTKLSDLVAWTKPYFYDKINYSDDAENILVTDLSKEVLFLIDRLEKIEVFSKENIEKAFRGVTDDLGIKAKVLIHPSRVALTGTRVGPGLFELMEVLSKGRVTKRLNDLVSHWRCR